MSVKKIADQKMGKQPCVPPKMPANRECPEPMPEPEKEPECGEMPGCCRPGCGEAGCRLKEGDEVVLASGSPPMTIESICAETGRATLKFWCDDTQGFRTEKMATHMLRAADCCCYDLCEDCLKALCEMYSRRED